MHACVCVRACVCACVRACVCVCVHVNTIHLCWMLTLRWEWRLIGVLGEPEVVE